MSNPEELLAQILKSNKKIAFGQTIGTNTEGNCLVQTDDGSILARSPDQISAGSAIALKADDGQWYAVSARESGLVQRSKIFSRKNKVNTEVEPELSNIIFLFQDEETREGITYITFWVGGDRDSPEQIYEFESTNREFVYGSIQKTGVYKNSFVVNLIIKTTPPVDPVDETEPITYSLYKIESLDTDGLARLFALTDNLLVANVYDDGFLSIKRQELILPQYPNRSGTKLGNDRSTLNDKGYYQGFNTDEDICNVLGQVEGHDVGGTLWNTFVFQYGYFKGFEIAEATISEVRSGEWINIKNNNLAGAENFATPPIGFIKHPDTTDLLPQFTPKKFQSFYEIEYDYSAQKYKNRLFQAPEYSIKLKGTKTNGQPIEPMYIYETYIKNPAITSFTKNPVLTQGQTTENSVLIDYDGISVFNDGNRVWEKNYNWILSGLFPVDTVSFSAFLFSTAVFRPRTNPLGVYKYILGIIGLNFIFDPTRLNLSMSLFYYFNNRSQLYAGQFGDEDVQYYINPASLGVDRSFLLEETYEDGCGDVDSDDYNVPEQEYSTEGYPIWEGRNEKTCTYNPFVFRSHQRLSEYIFDENNTTPAINLFEQSFSVNNPVSNVEFDSFTPDILNPTVYTGLFNVGKFTGSSEVLNNTGFKLAEVYNQTFNTGDTTLQVVMGAFKGVDPLQVKTFFENIEYKAVSYDRQDILTKKTERFQHDRSRFNPRAYRQMINQHSTFGGYACTDFDLPVNFFGEITGYNNYQYRNITDRFHLNYGLDSTLFSILSYEEESDGGTNGLSEENFLKAPIRVVKTVLGDEVVHKAYGFEFIGDKKGTIVDASAYFEED